MLVHGGDIIDGNVFQSLYFTAHDIIVTSAYNQSHLLKATPMLNSTLKRKESGFKAAYDHCSIQWHAEVRQRA